MPYEDQLRKVVFVPWLVSQLFPQAADKLSTLELDWTNPDVSAAMAVIHPANTSIMLPNTIWSEADAVAWTASALSKSAMAAIHAVLNNRVDKYDRRRKFPNIASCHHKDHVIPDLAVVCSGTNSENVVLGVTIEVKTNAAYRIPKTNFKKFDNLQRLRSDNDIGKAMRFNWPEVIPDNDSQTRMLTQVSAIVDIAIRSTHYEL